MANATVKQLNTLAAALPGVIAKLDGERKREYVGTDPKKIKAAQDAIARARDYDVLAERARQIEATLYEGGQRLASAVDYLSGKRKW